MPSGEWLESTTPITGCPACWLPSRRSCGSRRPPRRWRRAAPPMSWMPPMSFSQLVHFALEHQRFLLAHGCPAPASCWRLHVLQALDRGLDGLEVGQHAAEPAGVDEGHAGAARLRRPRFRAPGAWYPPSGRCRGWRPAACAYFIASWNIGSVFSRLMMWILLRWPKMNGAILGFQKRVWWPKVAHRLPAFRAW